MDWLSVKAHETLIVAGTDFGENTSRYRQFGVSTAPGRGVVIRFAPCEPALTGLFHLLQDGTMIHHSIFASLTAGLSSPESRCVAFTASQINTADLDRSRIVCCLSIHNHCWTGIVVGTTEEHTIESGPCLYQSWSRPPDRAARDLQIRCLSSC